MHHHARVSYSLRLCCLSSLRFGAPACCLYTQQRICDGACGLFLLCVGTCEADSCTHTVGCLLCLLDGVFCGLLLFDMLSYFTLHQAAHGAHTHVWQQRFTLFSLVTRTSSTVKPRCMCIYATDNPMHMCQSMPFLDRHRASYPHKANTMQKVCIYCCSCSHNNGSLSNSASTKPHTYHVHPSCYSLPTTIHTAHSTAHTQTDTQAGTHNQVTQQHSCSYQRQRG